MHTYEYKTQKSLKKKKTHVTMEYEHGQALLGLVGKYYLP